MPLFNPTSPPPPFPSRVRSSNAGEGRGASLLKPHPVLTEIRLCPVRFRTPSPTLPAPAPLPWEQLPLDPLPSNYFPSQELEASAHHHSCPELQDYHEFSNACQVPVLEGNSQPPGVSSWFHQFRAPAAWGSPQPPLLDKQQQQGSGGVCSLPGSRSDGFKRSQSSSSLLPPLGTRGGRAPQHSLLMEGSVMEALQLLEQLQNEEASPGCSAQRQLLLLEAMNSAARRASSPSQRQQPAKPTILEDHEQLLQLQHSLLSMPQVLAAASVPHNHDQNQIGLFQAALADSLSRQVQPSLPEDFMAGQESAGCVASLEAYCHDDRRSLDSLVYPTASFLSGTPNVGHTRNRSSPPDMFQQQDEDYSQLMASLALGAPTHPIPCTSSGAGGSSPLQTNQAFLPGAMGRHILFPGLTQCPGAGVSMPASLMAGAGLFQIQQLHQMQQQLQLQLQIQQGRLTSGAIESSANKHHSLYKVASDPAARLPHSAMCCLLSSCG